jgi:hypothetical protein
VKPKTPGARSKRNREVQTEPRSSIRTHGISSTFLNDHSASAHGCADPGRRRVCRGHGRRGGGVRVRVLRRRHVVSGVFAAGLHAAGVFVAGVAAAGFVSAGVFAAGVYAAGIFAFRAYALGVFAFGANATGVFAFGVNATGLFARGKHATSLITLPNTRRVST